MFSPFTEWDELSQLEYSTLNLHLESITNVKNTIKTVAVIMMLNIDFTKLKLPVPTVNTCKLPNKYNLFAFSKKKSLTMTILTICFHPLNGTEYNWQHLVEWLFLVIRHN